MTILGLLRWVGVVFGILAAVSLAQSGLGFRFHEDFLPLLEYVQTFIARFFQPFDDILVQPVVRWLHEQGLVFQLYPHRRDVFVLLWLFNSSYSVAFAPLARSKEPGDSDSGHSVPLTGRKWIIGFNWFTVFSWLLAFLVALVGGTLAGTVPLNNNAVFWWPFAAFFFFVSARAFLAAHFQNPLHARPGTIALSFAIPSVFLAAGLIRLPGVAADWALLWWAVAAYFAYAAALVLRLDIHRSLQSTRKVAALLAVFMVIAVAVALAAGILRSPSWVALDSSPSPGLASLAAFVAILALVDLFSAAFWTVVGEGEFVERWFNSAKAKSAGRILFVLGAATVIVWFARA